VGPRRPAHEIAGALALARGDLDGAEAHLAAERSALGPDPQGQDVASMLRSEAEVAIWCGRPEDASRAARKGVLTEPGGTR
jgi:hypothetical protein